MPKHACSLKNVLCQLKSACNFWQNLICMFLIHFPKFISMFYRAHLKSVTFGATCLKAGIYKSQQGKNLAFKGKGMNSKPQGFSTQAGVFFPTLLLAASSQWHFAHCREAHSVSSPISSNTLFKIQYNVSI